jgi:hypothetical protein
VKDGLFVLRPIGRVESPLVDLALAPKQGDEGPPMRGWCSMHGYGTASATCEPVQR